MAMAASATRRPEGGPRRRGGLPRRSPTEWAVRGGLALLVAVLGYYIVTFSLAQVVVKSDPQRAHRLAPYDGRITARLASKLSAPEASAADRRRGEEMARLALRQDPTAVGAVSALGLNAQVRGDTANARRYFAYAEKLSRRDTVTQLWAIENSVGRGDIKGALRHYDTALRVKPQLSELLYPVLTKASTEPAIRTELIRTLAMKPAWGDSFVTYAAGNGADPRATAALLVGLQRAAVTVPEAARASAVNALVAGNLFDQAWAYYAGIRPGSDRRRSRDPKFAARIETPTLLDWTTISDAGATAVIESGVFDFSAPASIGGPLLQQEQLLPPGTYRLSGHSDGIEQADNARPYWLLSCRNGRELGRVVVPNSAQAGGNFFGSFAVPADCPAQVLNLVARPSEAVSGLSGRIDRVELVPAR